MCRWGLQVPFNELEGIRSTPRSFNSSCPNQRSCWMGLNHNGQSLDDCVEAVRIRGKHVRKSVHNAEAGLPRLWESAVLNFERRNGVKALD